MIKEKICTEDEIRILGTGTLLGGSFFKRLGGSGYENDTCIEYIAGAVSNQDAGYDPGDAVDYELIIKKKKK